MQSKAIYLTRRESSNIMPNLKRTFLGTYKIFGYLSGSVHNLEGTWNIQNNGCTFLGTNEIWKVLLLEYTKLRGTFLGIYIQIWGILL